ncbi:MAG: polysaccharide deacetylase family protein [Deltaproteobacteria bacterium]|nr:polysaccharide deacetylase family protein [Deltaproteobacteria bacterium]
MRAIVTLHSVDETGSVLSIRPSELESLLDAIEKARHEVVSLGELLTQPGRPDRIAVTFDDALASVAEEGLPILARRGYPASVFVVTDRVGRDNAWPGQPAGIPDMPSMGWGELQALAEAGWEIGSHTHTHAKLTRLSEAAVRAEIAQAHAVVERELGLSPTFFAYPYGAVNDTVRRVAGEFHRFAVAGRLSALDSALDHPLELPRLDGFYLRSARVHRWFGSALFDGWVGLRRRAREARNGRLTP